MDPKEEMLDEPSPRDSIDELPMLSAEQCLQLAEAVRTNSDIAQDMDNLNLSGLTVEDARDEFCSIFEAIPENKNIKTVAFGPGVTTAMLVRIAKALLNSPSVTDLTIDQCFVPCLEIATIIGNMLKTPTCSLVCLALENLEFTSDGVKEVARSLMSNCTLKSISFAHNGIGNLGAKHLGTMLQRNTTLTQVSFAYNKIGGSGTEKLVRSLSRNSSLTSLDLSHNKISIKTANDWNSFFRHNRTLKELSLGWNRLEDSGALLFAHCLSSNSTIARLCIDANNIGPAGGAALQGMLEKNYSLTELSFKDNDFDSITRSSFSRLIKRNCSFEEIRKAFSSQDEFEASGALLKESYKKQAFLDAFPLEELLECSVKGGNKPGFALCFSDCVLGKKRFPQLKEIPSLLVGENDIILLEAIQNIDKTNDLSTLRDDDGDSMLHWAVSSSPCVRESTALKIVRLLLDRGCDPNEHSSRTGVTPFLLVQNRALLDELLERDADFGACDLSGCGVDSYFTTELLEHMRTITERREFHKSSQDFIVGVFGNAMGCRALPGTFYTAPEQLIVAVMDEIHRRNTTPNNSDGSRKNVHDSRNPGPWWCNNENCPQRMPLGCFPMVRMTNGRLFNGNTAEIIRRMSCGDRAAPVLRVCDFDKLSTTVALPVHTVVFGVISSDTPEQNRLEFWNTLSASLQKIREKNSDVKAVFLCLDSRAESSVTTLLKQKGTKHIPSSDLMYRAKSCGFDAFAEIGTTNITENLLMLIDSCLAFHCKTCHKVNAPIYDKNAGFMLHLLTPFVTPPPIDEQHGRTVKVLIVNQQNARIGPQQVIDHVFEQKKHILRMQRAQSKRHPHHTSSHSLIPIKRFVEAKKLTLVERPTVTVNVFAFTGSFDIPERLLLEQFMSQQDTLYVLCINLSDNNCIDTFRDWLEFLENNPNGPSSSSKLLVICSFFSNIPSTRAVNPPWKFCQDTYEKVKGALQEWSANTKVSSSIIQVCDKKVDGKKSLNSLEELNGMLSRLVLELADSVTSIPPFLFDIVHGLALYKPPSSRSSPGNPTLCTPGTSPTVSPTSSPKTPVRPVLPSVTIPSKPIIGTLTEPVSPRLSTLSSALSLGGSVMELAKAGMTHSNSWILTAESAKARLPASLREKIDKMPNPLGIVEEALCYLHKTGSMIYFHSGNMTRSLFADSDGNNGYPYNGGVASVDPWKFVNAFESLFSVASFLQLEGCLTFEVLKTRLISAVEDITSEEQVAQFVVALQAAGLCTMYCTPGSVKQALVIPSLFSLPEQSAFMICESLPIPEVELLHCKCVAFTCSSCHIEFTRSDSQFLIREDDGVCPNCKSRSTLTRVCSKSCKHCQKRSGVLDGIPDFLLIQSESESNVKCMPIPRGPPSVNYRGNCGFFDAVMPSTIYSLPKNLVRCKRCFDSLKSEGSLLDDPHVGSCFYRVTVLNTDYTFSGLRLMSLLTSRFSRMLLVDGFTTGIRTSGVEFTTPAYSIFSDIFGNIITLWAECQIPYSAPKDRSLANRAMLCNNMDLTVYIAVKGFAPLRALDSFQLSFLGIVEPLCPYCAVLYEDYRSRLVCPILPNSSKTQESAEGSNVSSTSTSSNSTDDGTSDPSKGSGDIPITKWSRPELTYVCLSQRHTMSVPVYYPGGSHD